MSEEQHPRGPIQESGELLCHLCKVLNIPGPVARITLECTMNDVPKLVVTRYLRTADGSGLVESLDGRFVFRTTEEKIGEATSGG